MTSIDSDTADIYSLRDQVEMEIIWLNSSIHKLDELVRKHRFIMKEVSGIIIRKGDVIFRESDIPMIDSNVLEFPK